MVKREREREHSLDNYMHKKLRQGMDYHTVLDEKLCEEHPALVEKYKLEKSIGGGGQATVYKAFRRSDGKVFAIKTVHGPDGLFEARLMAMLEVSLKGLDEQGLVHFEQLIREEPNQYGEVYHLVLELCNCSLHDRIKYKGQLDEEESAKIVIALAKTLKRVHDNEIIHCDLKPANVLLKYPRPGKFYVPKVSDFGMACWMEDPWNERGAGTWDYMSPEAMLDGRYITASDVWGLGMLLYTCLTATCPFPNMDVEVVFKNARKRDRNLRNLHHNSMDWDSIPSLSARQLIQGMTELDPGRRFTLEKQKERERTSKEKGKRVREGETE
ncbi:probable serine/threonine-protein kinase CCRP1 [Selaginella moellendorffii]|uniref:probable serine/threonine-protein kinase CCRP1 n=1 Tax=Selaginella moellendorffii TaxID=88036 RepID=UPI000D1CCBB2|nr:probable serine/threonine-protein kinase CCRP1 [Selaginella moellendorffii]|eukprot:XP_002979828.2 probable serine/threonine-protein kinase CCRP1 [Selaginella moellendorffii]